MYYSMKKYWSNMRELMYSVFKFQGVKSVVADELSVLPGMEEGAAFLWLEKFYSEKFYDVVIIDTMSDSGMAHEWTLSDRCSAVATSRLMNIVNEIVNQLHFSTSEIIFIHVILELPAGAVGLGGYSELQIQSRG